MLPLQKLLLAAVLADKHGLCQLSTSIFAWLDACARLQHVRQG